MFNTKAAYRRPTQSQQMCCLEFFSKCFGAVNSSKCFLGFPVLQHQIKQASNNNDVTFASTNHGSSETRVLTLQLKMLWKSEITRIHDHCWMVHLTQQHFWEKNKQTPHFCGGQEFEHESLHQKTQAQWWILQWISRRMLDPPKR